MMFFFILVHYRSCTLKGTKAISATQQKIGELFKNAAQKRKKKEPNGEKQHGSKRSKEPLTIDSDLDQSDKEM